MNNKKWVCILLGLSFFLTCNIAYAQQEAMYTQYMFNGLALNPAYAGSHEAVSMTFLAREQWTGVEGAPSTQTLSVHSPIKNKRIALGLNLIRDKITVFNQTGVNAVYAYRIPTENGTLSMGLQLGVTSYKADFQGLNIFPPDGDDPAFSQDVSKAMLNFGAGMYYYTNRFYLGFSVPQMINNSLSEDIVGFDSDARQERHYFLTSGYVIDVSGSVKFKPNVLFKVVGGAPVEMDLNANFLFSEVLWVGLSWRSLADFDALLEFQVTDQLLLGYSYDFANTTDLRRVNSGSHELMINYRLRYSKKKVVTPRYF